MLFDVERDEILDRADRVECVQIEPLMFEHAPPGLDERVGKRDLRHGQKPIQDAGPDQLIDFYIEVLDTSVDEQRGFGILQMPRGAEKKFSCRARVERGGYLPGQNAAREVVDDSVEVSSVSIEKADQRRIHMPNLVGTRGTNADFRLDGMNTFARSPPFVNPDQPVPGRRRGEDLAQPLCEQSQRSRWHMAVLVGSDHFLNRVDLGWRQLLGR